MRHSLNFCGWKDRKNVAKDLKRIYKATDDVEAEKALADFEAEWGRKYPSIALSWRRAWQEVIPFFAFPPAVRKIIYTTNAIESLNKVIRKTTKTRGSFPTDDAATKLIYLAIRNFEKAGRCVKEWVSRTFLIGRFMYHAICPLLFSTCEGLGSRRRVRPSQVVRLVGAVHAACFLSFPIPFPLAS